MCIRQRLQANSIRSDIQSGWLIILQNKYEVLYANEDDDGDDDDGDEDELNALVDADGNNNNNNNNFQTITMQGTKHKPKIRQRQRRNEMCAAAWGNAHSGDCRCPRQCDDEQALTLTISQQPDRHSTACMIHLRQQARHEAWKKCHASPNSEQQRAPPWRRDKTHNGQPLMSTKIHKANCQGR